ncbi:transglycosylase SLT domain-containing protein [Fictibacillus gelatini]|uniref:transglycosylase SLT domain-containing protein n=1 Tax=Fictibacillus gelatini TaxID=225985 RepID=UPI00040DB167|nr:transglycosylase SLT domain-containing protein [Fictibacillus gelatini]
MEQLRNLTVDIGLYTDTSPLMNVNREINQFKRQAMGVGSEVNKMASTFKSATQGMIKESQAFNKQVSRQSDLIRKLARTSGMSAAHLAADWSSMSDEMRKSLIKNHNELMKHRKDLLLVKNDMRKLGSQMGHYTSTTDDFMAEIQRLGKQHKKISDQMINNNLSTRQSLIQTVATMSAMSGQSDKIASSYDRIGSSLLKVNKPLLAVTSGLERMARNGNAAALALRLLGPNAKMKELLDMQRMINQGTMRYQMVAIAALAAGAMFYHGLHKAARDSVPGYAKAFDQMQESMRKAFQPMVDVFASVMVPVFKFIKYIADLTIKFNEAHPVLAKIIQGFLLLIPAVTLLLAPLAVGIGLFAGMKAAFASVWMLIGPLVTGLGAMMGTVLLVSASIVGLVTVIYLLWKHFETLRNVVSKTWSVVKNTVLIAVDAISKVTSAMWNNALESTHNLRITIVNEISEMGRSIVYGFQVAVEKTAAFFSVIGTKIADFIGKGLSEKVGGITKGFINQLKTGFSSLGGIVSLIAPTITGISLSLLGVTGPISFVITGIVSLIGFLYRLSKTNESVRNTFVSIWSGIKSFLASVFSAIKPIIDVFAQSFSQMATELGPEFQKTGQIIAQSFVSLKPTFVELGKALKDLFSTMGGMFSETVATVAPLIGQLAQSFASFIPQVVPLIGQLIQAWMKVQSTIMSAVIQIVQTVLPMLSHAFSQILPMVLQVVKSVLPVVISLIQTLVPVISRIAMTVIPLFLKAVQTVLPVVLTVIQTIMPVVIDLFSAIIPIITRIAITLIPAILKAVQQVFPVILQIIQMVIPIIAALLRVVVQVINTFLIPAIRFILKIVQIVFPSIMSIIKNALNIVTNVIRLFTSVLKGDWSGAWTAVKNILKSAWGIIKTVIKTGLDMAVQFIKSGWNTAKTFTASIFTGIKDKVSSTFKNIVDAAKALPGKIGDGIKSMAGKALNGVKALGSKLAGGLENIVNKITQDGINNMVLKPLGVKNHLIPKLDIPGYARGTGYHPGGPAILGDGGQHELFRTPKGQIGLSPATDTLMNLPKGTQVLSGKQTLQALNGLFPAYKSGNVIGNGLRAVGNWIKDTSVSAYNSAKNVGSAAVNKTKDLALDVWSYMSNPGKLVKKIFSSLGIKPPDVPGVFGGIGKGAINFVKSGAIDFVKKQMDSLGGMFSGSKPSGNVAQWIRAAMAATGVPDSWFSPLVTIAMKESGGNPRAYNGWDINAKRGIASRGLMQTIPPTFEAYKLPGMNDIWNPVHNAVAAIRYIKARYGTVFNTPGIRSMAHGGPYRGYANGGIATKPQWATLAENGWKEFIIPTQPSKRKRALGLLEQANSELGYSPNKGGSNYSPSVGSPVPSGGSRPTINYNPTINIEISGASDSRVDVKKAVQEALDEQWKKLISIYDIEVVR